MNRLFPAAVLVALAAGGALPAPVLASGTGTIQHCRDAQGVAIYTDRACASVGARPVPLSSDLAHRIAASANRPRERSPSPPQATRAAAPRAPSAGCARTATQLANDLEGAFALGDVNRIAESYHWVGLSHGQGQRVMQRLSRLSREPLLQAHYVNARIQSGGPGLAGTSGASSAAGLMQLVIGRGPGHRAMDLDVQHYQGCYFVRFRHGEGGLGGQIASAGQ